MKEALLKDICKNQPCEHGEGYCLLKEIILHDAKYSERLLAQMDCVNRFKYEEGQRLGQDPTWRGAYMAWVDRGYAAIFSELFNPEVPSVILFQRIMALATSRGEACPKTLQDQS